MSVDVLLEKGKGICRNYGIASEKVFDALKLLQRPETDLLKNSALVRFADTEHDGRSKGNERLKTLSVADTKGGAGYDGHMWNVLVTIDDGGTIHKTHVDMTHADGGDGLRAGERKDDGSGMVGRVRMSDRTHQRLVQDLVKDGVDVMASQKELLRYYAAIVESGIESDMGRIAEIREKLASFVKAGILDAGEASNALAPSSFGMLMLASGKYGEARSAYAGVLERDPNDWDAHYKT